MVSSRGSGPSFSVTVLKIYKSLLAANVNAELAWERAGSIARDSIRQADGRIASNGQRNYDGNPMSGTATKSKNGTAKQPVTEPLQVDVVPRGIARFLEQQGLNKHSGAKRFGIAYHTLKRLIDEPTPGLIGENIDKVCRAFGITRRQLEDIGKSAP